MSSDKERKEIFEKYNSLSEEIEFTKRHLSFQTQSRSLIVKEIYDKYGPGPFKYNGIYLTVSSRTNKLTGEETYFFKSPSSSNIEVI